MIYILILLDIIITNYTKYHTFFFILYLYNKSYKYYLITGLILDLIIFNSIFNTIILSILYIINKSFKNLNYQNILVYLFINLFNYIFYIVLSNLIYQNNIGNILYTIGFNLIINMIFYILGRNNLIKMTYN